MSLYHRHALYELPLFIYCVPKVGCLNELYGRTPLWFTSGIRSSFDQRTTYVLTCISLLQVLFIYPQCGHVEWFQIPNQNELNTKARFEFIGLNIPSILTPVSNSPFSSRYRHHYAMLPSTCISDVIRMLPIEHEHEGFKQLSTITGSV